MKTRLAIVVALALALAALDGGVGANASGSAPTAVTESAKAVSFTTATLAGKVDPNGGEVTECVFRYGTTPALEKTAPCSYSPGHGVTPVVVEAAVSGLTEGATYHFRVFAKNAGGESEGEEVQFTALPAAPRSDSQPPSNVTRTSATMNGFVNPEGAEVTECFFEYGETTSLGQSEPCSSLPGAGGEPVPVSAQLEGLAESSSTYYRLVSKNAFGTDTGPREHILTPPNQPNAKGEPINQVGRTTATLRGAVDPRASLVEQCYFEWGTTSVTEHTTPCSSLPGEGEGFVPVSAALEGLSESTTYFYRLVAVNAFGENASGRGQITTLPTLARAQLRTGNQVAARSALFKGVVDPEGTQITGCEFEYGTTPALGKEVACNLLPAGEGFQKVSAEVTGLAPSTQYFWRLAATNAFGTGYSGEMHFTTFEPGLLPTVRKVTPKKGPSLGGNAVTIKGTNLGETVSVSFGGVESEHVTVDSTEAVTAVAPPGAGVVDVVVTSVDGSSEPAASDHYTYGPAAVTEVSPGSGPTAGGTEVTVTGNGFLAGAGQTGFLFGKAPATNVVCTSLNTCTMTVPAEPKGKAKMVSVQAVVNGKKSPKAPGAVFTYTP